ncbi:LysR family transcriptional regulator [Massilia dura]|uniref:LysR family transcriptional regulator n=1 Tax=Pseudoduganella dura TaxID=321982 RepID=A0A6I3XF93_9BURK|nr:LysR family transcriptional regulator [Pseudoduganella dura]MUI11388.1 LysR family transcriptional regulator [Pseudoduganella dura]GGX95846.1 LysR family transcriptional regulator [Pseudoduganella dura]
MDNEKLDLNLLRVFDALMQTKHVTQAGEIVGLSQPAVSFALNKLRKLTGDALFVRTPKGMEPTPRATRMAPPVRQILEMVVRDVFNADQFTPATSTHRFTLSMTDIGELVFLPAMLKRLKREAPSVALEAVSMSPARLGEAMTMGSVDLALGYYPDITRADFYQQHLFTHSFAALVRTDHPRIGAQMTMDQFLAETHIVVRAAGRSQELFERHLEQAHIQRKVGLILPHFLSIQHVLPDTDMVATVPYSCAKVFSRARTVRMVGLPMQTPSFDVKQYWHSRQHSDPANQWLRQLVHEIFSNGIESI